MFLKCERHECFHIDELIEQIDLQISFPIEKLAESHKFFKIR